MDRAGRDLSEYMPKNVQRAAIPSPLPRNVYREACQGRTGYIALSFDTEMKAAPESSGEEKTADDKDGLALDR